MLQHCSPSKSLQIRQFSDGIVGKDQSGEVGEIVCQEVGVDFADPVIAEEEGFETIEDWEVGEGSDVVVRQVQRVVQVLFV